MIFITLMQAEELLGQDFSSTEAEKKRLVMLANTWMTNNTCSCLQNESIIEVPENLVIASSEIILAIKAGDIYGGSDRQTTSERVKADSVEVQETYADGSRAISANEQVALAMIEAECLSCNGGSFSIDLWRVVG